nr:hypothetical protein [Mycolicibacterium mucogenicum]
MAARASWLRWSVLRVSLSIWAWVGVPAEFGLDCFEGGACFGVEPAVHFGHSVGLLFADAEGAFAGAFGVIG